MKLTCTVEIELPENCDAKTLAKYQRMLKADITSIAINYSEDFKLKRYSVTTYARDN